MYTTKLMRFVLNFLILLKFLILTFNDIDRYARSQTVYKNFYLAYNFINDTHAIETRIQDLQSGGPHQVWSEVP